MGAFPSPAMLITDLDGTLLGSDGTMTRPDHDALVHLGQCGVVRVIATGRSLYSFHRAVGADMPVDYVIFSTGAGVITFPGGNLIRNTDLNADAVATAVRIFQEYELDFMVHRPIPYNHQFVYFDTGRENPDFHRRIDRYAGFCQPIDRFFSDFGDASQLLAVVDHDKGASVHAAIAAQLSDFSVVRSTSPLDGRSVWIEVFASGVSKSRTAAWLADRLNIHKELVLSVGNDYNDQDLLEWSGTAFLVGNAPDALKLRFPAVAAQKQAGVAQAIHRWLANFCGEKKCML